MTASRAIDEESAAIMYEGATVRQLSILFKQDAKVVASKMISVVPSGTRKGASLYFIYDAAPRLVKPSYEIERIIKNMNHSDLPPMLSSAFWSAQKTRAAFEEMSGDLWRTTQVVGLIARLFNSVRMILLLMPDTIEREVGLTDAQKTVFRRGIKGALTEGRKTIIKEFKKYGNGPESTEDGKFTTGDVKPNTGRNRISQTEADSDPYHGL